IGGALHLVRCDPAARHRAGAGGAASVSEPGALGWRVHLGAHPDVVLAGVSVDLFHQLARLVGKPRAGCWFLQGHDAPPDRRGRQSPAMVASIKVKPSKQAMCLLRAALPLLRYNGLETIATAWQGA